MDLMPQGADMRPLGLYCGVWPQHIGSRSNLLVDDVDTLEFGVWGSLEVSHAGLCCVFCSCC